MFKHKNSVNNFFMKKYLLLVIALIIPLGFIINQSTYDFYKIFKNYSSSTFCYIFNAENKSIKENLYISNNDIKCIKNGSKEFVYFKNINILKYFQNNAEMSDNLEYMQVQSKLTQGDVKNILKTLNAKILLQEKYNNNSIIYCYTPVWQNFKILNGLKVNLQIVFNSELSTIGHPMIYGSF